MINQKFDIDVYFTIRYFADKHGKTITRAAKWTKDCLYGTHKKHGYPYIKYFDDLATSERTLNYLSPKMDRECFKSNERNQTWFKRL